MLFLNFTSFRPFIFVTFLLIQTIKGQSNEFLNGLSYIDFSDYEAEYSVIIEKSDTPEKMFIKEFSYEAYVNSFVIQNNEEKRFFFFPQKSSVHLIFDDNNCKTESLVQHKNLFDKIDNKIKTPFSKLEIIKNNIDKLTFVEEKTLRDIKVVVYKLIVDGSDNLQMNVYFTKSDSIKDGKSLILPLTVEYIEKEIVVNTINIYDYKEKTFKYFERPSLCLGDTKGEFNQIRMLYEDNKKFSVEYENKENKFNKLNIIHNQNYQLLRIDDLLKDEIEIFSLRKNVLFKIKNGNLETKFIDNELFTEDYKFFLIISDFFDFNFYDLINKIKLHNENVHYYEKISTDSNYKIIYRAYLKPTNDQNVYIPIKIEKLSYKKARNKKFQLIEQEVVNIYAYEELVKNYDFYTNFNIERYIQSNLDSEYSNKLAVSIEAKNDLKLDKSKILNFKNDLHEILLNFITQNLEIDIMEVFIKNIEYNEKTINVNLEFYKIISSLDAFRGKKKIQLPKNELVVTEHFKNLEDCAEYMNEDFTLKEFIFCQNSFECYPVDPKSKSFRESIDDCLIYTRKNNLRVQKLKVLEKGLKNLIEDEKLKFILEDDKIIKFLSLKPVSNKNDKDKQKYNLVKKGYKFNDLYIKTKLNKNIRSVTDCLKNCLASFNGFKCNSFSLCRSNNFGVKNNICYLSDFDSENLAKTQLIFDQNFSNDIIKEEIDYFESNSLCDTYSVTNLIAFNKLKDKKIKNSYPSINVKNENECAKQCLSQNQQDGSIQKCLTFELCENESNFKCKLTNTYVKNLETDYSPECSVYEVNYFADFHLIGFHEKKEKVIRLEDNQCAQKCLLNENCKSFDSCTGIENQNDVFCELSDALGEEPLDKSDYICSTFIKNEKTHYLDEFEFKEKIIYLQHTNYKKLIPILIIFLTLGIFITFIIMGFSYKKTKKVKLDSALPVVQYNQNKEPDTNTNDASLYNSYSDLEELKLQINNLPKKNSNFSDGIPIISTFKNAYNRNSSVANDLIMNNLNENLYDNHVEDSNVYISRENYESLFNTVETTEFNCNDEHDGKLI